jgi:hypothetical protein
LNHLQCLVVKWVNNIYVCAVSPLFSRHKKKIAFLAVRESKAVNDKAVKGSWLGRCFKNMTLIYQKAHQGHLLQSD